MHNGQSGRAAPVLVSCKTALSAEKQNEYQSQQERNRHERGNLVCRSAAHWFVPSTNARRGHLPVTPLGLPWFSAEQPDLLWLADVPFIAESDRRADIPGDRQLRANMRDRASVLMLARGSQS
jgi:hypothetical protein